MDIPTLPLNLLEGGRDYDRALRKLGLRAEGVSWGYDVLESRFFLFVIWSGVDRFGPLAISELLFQAYNASALPQEIDPFIVTLMSPEHLLADAMMSADVGLMFRQGPSEDPEAAHVHFQTDWFVHMQKKPRASIEVVHDWKRFNDRVKDLAA